MDTNGNFTTINFPRATATTARGINDGGQIVGDFGNSIDQFGQYTPAAFLATPVTTPEPPSLFTLASCLVALFAMVWRRKRSSGGIAP